MFFLWLIDTKSSSFVSLFNLPCDGFDPGDSFSLVRIGLLLINYAVTRYLIVFGS